MQYDITPVGKFNLGVREIWDYRELFFFFTWRDIKVKYKQTVLGFVWVILQPLMLMIIFSLFFGSALGVPSQNIPYPIFVYSGLLVWNIFSSGLSNAANSMVNNAGIIKKIYFPRLIIPISAILISLFDFLMAFVIYIGLLIYYQHPVSWYIILLLPASLLITVFTTFGLGCWLAALNVKYRDFRYVIPFLIQSLLFITPVIYPTSVIKIEWAKYIIALNPMTAAIDLLRAAVTNETVNIFSLLIGSLTSVFLLIWGLYYFRKTEFFFADLA